MLFVHSVDSLVERYFGKNDCLLNTLREGSLCNEWVNVYLPYLHSVDNPPMPGFNTLKGSMAIHRWIICFLSSKKDYYAGTLLYSPIRRTTSSSTSLITTRRPLVKQDKETRASIVFLGSIAILNGDDSLIRNDSPAIWIVFATASFAAGLARLVRYHSSARKEELRINSLREHHKLLRT